MGVVKLPIYLIILNLNVNNALQIFLQQPFSFLIH